MPQTLDATTADVLIGFQTRPGIESDSIIKAGEATIKGSSTKIKPQGKGYYGFKIQPGSSVVMQLLGTDYHVYYQSDDEMEKADTKQYAITNWKVTGDKKRRLGIQRRLQMLGYYYNGRVDKKMGHGTEFAVLGFQADNKLRTDGELGRKTWDKLDDIVEKKNKAGKVYISRRSMIRFGWAPHSKKAKVYYGWPKKTAPMVDDRGSLKVKSAGIDLHGPVVCVQRKTNFRVRVIREFISKNATLVATSDDENLVAVTSAKPLPSEEKFILNLESKDPGRKPKATSVKIKYKKGDTEIEIASLQVIVMPLKVVKVRVCYVTVKDATGKSLTPANTPGGSASAPDVFALNQFKKNFRMSKALARNILRHYGIYLKFMPDRTKTVTLAKAGTLTQNGNNYWRSELTKIMTTKDDSNKLPSKKELNVSVVSEVEDARGLAWLAVVYSWPNGIVMMEDPEGVLRTAWILAHEIGHMLGLANYIGKKQGSSSKEYPHADDDPSATKKKKDLWTVSRLMYAFTGHSRPINPGFGYKKPGGKLSIRNLPSDPADNEVSHANWWARHAQFYCKP